jgi:hypothetical protein
MVAQKVVKEVMEILNKPCNAREIAEYMIANGLSNIASDILPDVSTCLNSLRKWEVVDKLPDQHGLDSNKWYLTNGKHHDTENCIHCKNIIKAHNRNIAQFIIRSTNRNYKTIDDDDDHIENWGYDQ